MIMPRSPWDITDDMFLSVDESESLVAHVRNAEALVRGRDRLVASLDRLIVEVLLYSGLRNSEFCRLSLADTMLGHRESSLIVRGPGRERRTVFVPGALSKLITTYARDTRPKFLPDRVAEDDLSRPLVLNEHRRPFERTGLYRRVVRILTQAGLADRASVQLLRHTYGYLAYLRTGGNLLFVQRQLGHAHPMITSIYAQFVPESYADMADCIATRQARISERSGPSKLAQSKGIH